MNNRSKSLKDKRDSTGRRNVENTESGGTGEGEGSPGKKDKKKRHKITFMDEITNDKTQLTEVHYIESYKKYNQEFYME